jgi:hypothetical protein
MGHGQISENQFFKLDIQMFENIGLNCSIKKLRGGGILDFKGTLTCKIKNT